MTIHAWNRFHRVKKPFQRPHAVRTLTIMDANVSDLIHALPDFTNLVELSLNWYAGRELPVVVWHLPKLRVLYVLNTPIEHLPDSVPEGLHLKKFAVRQGDLVSLPHWLTHMQSLVHLDFWQNALTFLPNDIGKLSQLTFLRCGCNEITKLPDSIGHLKKLKLLDMRDNMLKAVPATLFQLKKLQYVNFEGNVIPPEIQQDIRQLQRKKWGSFSQWLS